MTEILVIDDDRDNRDFAKVAFTNTTIPDRRFTEASTKEQAAELIRKKRFDIIVMDMELSTGGREGAELITLARNGTPNQDTAIIGWSSYRGYATAMQQAGADAFASKRYQNHVSPIDQLVTATYKALSLAKSRQPEQYAFYTDIPPEPPTAQRTL